MLKESMAEDLRSKDVAEILGVAIPTVALWRKENRGPKYYKLQGQYRYPQADLEEFIDKTRRTF